MKYKVFWKLTDEFIDLCTKNGNKDIDTISAYEFENDEGNDFSSKVNRLVELCCSYYPHGEIYYAEYQTFKSGYVYLSINKRQIKAAVFEIRVMPFYAVQSNYYTYWDDGTYDLSEAIDMARDRMNDGKTGVQIAVIDKRNNFCYNCYIYNEEFDRFELDIPGNFNFKEYGFAI